NPLKSGENRCLVDIHVQRYRPRQSLEFFESPTRCPSPDSDGGSSTCPREVLGRAEEDFLDRVGRCLPRLEQEGEVRLAPGVRGALQVLGVTAIDDPPIV